MKSELGSMLYLLHENNTRKLMRRLEGIESAVNSLREEVRARNTVVEEVSSKIDVLVDEKEETDSLGALRRRLSVPIKSITDLNATLSSHEGVQDLETYVAKTVTNVGHKYAQNFNKALFDKDFYCKLFMGSER